MKKDEYTDRIKRIWGHMVYLFDRRLRPTDNNIGPVETTPMAEFSSQSDCVNIRDEEEFPAFSLKSSYTKRQ